MSEARDDTQNAASGAEKVLRFWFADEPASRESMIQSRWFFPTPEFDQLCTTRFLASYEDAAHGRLEDWKNGPRSCLALVLLLDQFPRNMFRGDAKAYSNDDRALEVARRALARGTDRQIEAPLLQFLYLPFMHSEDLADQLRCVDLFRTTDDTENLRYAEEHADIIRRFGRFPHRNRVLGRVTTPEEQAFLDGGGFSG